MKNLKRIVLILCLLMTVPFSIHSQDTSKILITSDQLRTANLIFAEHKEYSKLVPLLHQENSNLQIINDTWIKTDSIKTVQIYKQNQIISEQLNSITKMKKSLTICGSVAGACIITTVLCLLLK